jgi:hypothetical protein
MKTMRLTTATLIAMGALTLGSCIYDRAPGRATASVWDTRDHAGEPMDERRASINDITSPYEGAGRPPSGGGPGSDEGGAPGETGDDVELTAAEPRGDERVSERVDPRTGERTVVIEDADHVEVRVRPAARAGVAEVSEEPVTSAQAEEAPAGDPRRPDQPEPGDAPLVQDAEPEETAVADPALRDIARDEPSDEPLIAEGVLRDESCPMEIEGARVALVERREGPALVFQTRDPDDVEELQSRVMALALTKDDERVEEPASGTRAALVEEPGPDVEPPEQTEMQEGAEGDMPFNLPTELTAAEQEEEREAEVAGRFAPLPEAEVTVELTDDGAQVLFEPLAGGERGALTRQLETRARALREGECPADTMSMLTTEPG